MKLDLKKLRARTKAGRIQKQRREAAQRREEAAHQRQLDREALALIKPQLPRIKELMLELADEGESGIQLFRQHQNVFASSWTSSNHRKVDGAARGLALWAKNQGLRVEIIFESFSRRSSVLTVNAYW